MREKKIVFAGICLGSIVLVFGYVYWARTRLSAAEPSAVPSAKLVAPVYVKTIETEPHAAKTPTPSREPSQNESPKRVEPVQELGRIFFRHNGLDANYGRVAFVRRRAARGTRVCRIAALRSALRCRWTRYLSQCRSRCGDKLCC